MSIHYKFKNTINYDAVKFDSVYISAADLKSIIVQQKKLGHSELQVMNEETGTVYADQDSIPKNTNIIVSRIPFANSNKRARMATNNHHHGQDKHGTGSMASGSAHGGSGPSSGGGVGSASAGIGGGGSREAMELVSTKDMSEEEKLKYIQSQSTKDFDITRYARGGGRGGRGGGRGNHHRHFVPGPGYTCRKCGIPGHSIYDCKMSHMMKVKRSTGIPRDFLEKADSKEKGAVLTPSGEYAVHYLDREAYSNPKVEKAPFFEDSTPDDNTKPTPTTNATAPAVTAPTMSGGSNRAKRKNPDDYHAGNNNDY